MCLPIISTENWKPATKTDQGEPKYPGLSHSRTCSTFHYILIFFFVHRRTVIQALIALVNYPEPDHPLRGDLAEEYLKDRDKFFKNAEDYTRKYGEKRPSDH